VSRQHERQLGLHEEVMLLALRNDRGTIAGGTMYAQAAGGAILAELLLRGRITAVPDGRSTYAQITNASPVGDGVLDECLAKMHAATRRKKLQTWVGKFAGVKGLKHRVAMGLAEKGILREDEQHLLLLFSRRVYPERDSTVERAIVDRLQQAILSDEATVDPRTTVLLALAHHSGLLKANLDRRMLKTRRARIEAIIKGDAIGKATKEAIQAVQTAVMMATVMPVILARH
jgi:hypothetical protein